MKGERAVDGPKSGRTAEGVGDRFVVMGLLGTGSMAHVYRAHQLEVDRPVALKVFRADAILSSRPDGSTREEAVERILEERF